MLQYGWTLKTCWVKEAIHKRTYVIWLHSYEIKFIKIESLFMVARVLGKRSKECSTSLFAECYFSPSLQVLLPSTLSNIFHTQISVSEPVSQRTKVQHYKFTLLLAEYKSSWVLHPYQHVALSDLLNYANSKMWNVLTLFYFVFSDY